MIDDEAKIEISNEVYWYKIVEFLQQNWAVIESEGSGFKVLFFDDCSGIFDSIEFDSLEDAETALKRNGFKNYNEDQEVHHFIAKPKAPLRGGAHLNNPIYSSGQFWH
ncbi:MAG: hypothetical protein ISR86_10005 [Nitrospinaceae bacterium]|nr:hypothetical protein [Nitrospinaceae bacterium]